MAHFRGGVESRMRSSFSASRGWSRGHRTSRAAAGTAVTTAALALLGSGVAAAPALASPVAAAPSLAAGGAPPETDLDPLRPLAFYAFRLPAVLGGERSDHGPVSHDEVVAALATRGCRTEPVLTVPDWSTVLRAGKVHLSFVRPTGSERPPDQLLLSNVGRSAEWQGDAP